MTTSTRSNKSKNHRNGNKTSNLLWKVQTRVDNLLTEYLEYDHFIVTQGVLGHTKLIFNFTFESWRVIHIVFEIRYGYQNCIIDKDAQ